jgi:hypothetical protein
MKKNLFTNDAIYHQRGVTNIEYKKLQKLFTDAEPRKDAVEDFFWACLTGNLAKIVEGFSKLKSYELLWHRELLTLYCPDNRIMCFLEGFLLPDTGDEQPGSFSAFAHELSVNGILQVLQACIVHS